MPSAEVRKHISEYFAGKPPSGGLPAADYYWERKRELVLELFAAHALTLPTPSEPRIFVDLGCGDGTDLAMIATFIRRKAGDLAAAKSLWRCIGIEGFPELLQASKDRMKLYALDDVELIFANIVKRLRLEDNSVDILYCSEVIEHIPSPPSLLNEIHRVVKPGGLALLTTPNEPNILQRSWWSSQRRAQVQPRLAGTIAHRSVDIEGEPVDIYGHISLQTNHSLDNLMQTIGFTLLDFRRGAAVYGGQPWLNRAPIHFGRKLVESTLDLMPRGLVRNISDQIIALYQKSR